MQVNKADFKSPLCGRKEYPTHLTAFGIIRNLNNLIKISPSERAQYHRLESFVRH